mmetsp:Transcript_53137/g.153347  ORF Transcript_53137/g.153347 Transcript_53137/m.153347 type:complete len:243 (-) Transcript_53137:287-1015(-)
MPVRQLVKHRQQCEHCVHNVPAPHVVAEEVQAMHPEPQHELHHPHHAIGCLDQALDQRGRLREVADRVVGCVQRPRAIGDDGGADEKAEDRTLHHFRNAAGARRLLDIESLSKVVHKCEAVAEHGLALGGSHSRRRLGVHPSGRDAQARRCWPRLAAHGHARLVHGRKLAGGLRRLGDLSIPVVVWPGPARTRWRGGFARLFANGSGKRRRALQLRSGELTAQGRNRRRVQLRRPGPGRRRR